MHPKIGGKTKSDISPLILSALYLRGMGLQGWV